MEASRCVEEIHKEMSLCAGDEECGFEFEVDHAARSVEPLNGVSKGGEHPLWSIVLYAGVNTPAAKWLRLLMRRQKKKQIFRVAQDDIRCDLFKWIVKTTCYASAFG